MTSSGIGAACSKALRQAHQLILVTCSADQVIGMKGGFSL